MIATLREVIDISRKWSCRALTAKRALLQRSRRAHSTLGTTIEHDIAQPVRAAAIGEQALDSRHPLGIGSGVVDGIERPGRRAHGDQREIFTIAQAGQRLAIPGARRGPDADHRAAIAIAEISGREEGLEDALLVDLGGQREAGQDDQFALRETGGGSG